MAASKSEPAAGAADDGIVDELRKQLEQVATERATVKAELDKKASKLGTLAQAMEEQDGRIASLTRDLEAAQTELEGLQIILATREPAAAPAAAAPAPAAGGGGDLSSIAPQVADLTARLDELHDMTAAGRERWKGVEMAVGKATQELLQLAGKEPTLQQTLYGLLPHLQQALDGGREVVSSTADGTDATQEALDALKRSLPGS